MNARYCDAIAGHAQPDWEVVQEQRGLLFIYPSIPCWGAGGNGHSWAGPCFLRLLKISVPGPLLWGRQGGPGDLREGVRT